MLVLAVLPAVFACRCGGGDAVAEVGRSRLTSADWTAFSSARSPALRESPAQVLGALADREALAEAARRDGTADLPEVHARVAAAEREALAQAYLDRKLAEATTDAALRQQWEARKATFTKRRVHVRQIVVRLAPNADQAAQTQALSKATQAYGRLATGEDFDKVASDLSDDRNPAMRDLGTIVEGQVDAALFEAAAALKKGESTKPVRTPFGFHVLQAVEEPSTFTPTFEQARGQLTALVRRDFEADLLARVRNDLGVTLHADRLPDGGRK